MGPCYMHATLSAAMGLALLQGTFNLPCVDWACACARGVVKKFWWHAGYIWPLDVVRSGRLHLLHHLTIRDKERGLPVHDH
jgi:hypothetical protein